MKHKRYWLRGIGVGLIVYISVAIILAVFFFSGTITCNEFITVGPSVTESFLCKPAIFLIGLPVMIVTELAEDISTGAFTHPGVYLGLLSSIVIYLGIFALLGMLYGKMKNRNKYE
jgi:hypothetical protein